MRTQTITTSGASDLPKWRQPVTLLTAIIYTLKTCFPKITDRADITPTAAVAFTINHIGAVILSGLDDAIKSGKRYETILTKQPEA